jgi:hypothetical protein
MPATTYASKEKRETKTLEFRQSQGRVLDWAWPMAPCHAGRTQLERQPPRRTAICALPPMNPITSCRPLLARISDGTAGLLLGLW